MVGINLGIGKELYTIPFENIAPIFKVSEPRTNLTEICLPCLDDLFGGDILYFIDLSNQDSNSTLLPKIIRGHKISPPGVHYHGRMCGLRHLLHYGHYIPMHPGRALLDWMERRVGWTLHG